MNGFGGIISLIFSAALGLAGVPDAAASVVQTPAWGLNEVSVLLPLGLAKPLVTGSSGPKGRLLPSSLEQKIGSLERTDTPLEVVGLRLDPCFLPTAATPRSQCRAQLRLVWQPVHRDPGVNSTEDAALHSFYEFSSDEFRQLTAEWIKRFYKTQAPDQPTDRLGAHPLIRLEGPGSPTWQSLRALVLKSCGEHNLSRVTFMRVRAPELTWEFGGWERTGLGEFEPLPIAGLPASPQSPDSKISQLFINGAQNQSPGGARTSEFLGGMKPVSSVAPRLLPKLLRRSANLPDPADPNYLSDDWPGLLQDLDRIENPRQTATDEIDCVSCHTAQSARIWLLKRLSGADELARPQRFMSQFSLQNDSPDLQDTSRLRAFGYRGRTAVVSQRVIHESAAVAEWLNGNTW